MMTTDELSQPEVAFLNLLETRDGMDELEQGVVYEMILTKKG